jgi:probable Rubsico expression protein CbbX
MTAADEPVPQGFAMPRPGADRPGADQHGADQHGTDQHGTDQHGTDQHGTDQHGTDQHGTDQHGTDQHGTDQEGGNQEGGNQEGGNQHGDGWHGTPREASASLAPGPPGAPPAGGRRPGGEAGPAALEPLAPDATVDLAAQEQARRISQMLEALDAEFVGLAPVKDRVREIAALLLIDRLRGRYGLASSRPSLHMCFTGSPGTGKTTVATHMGELLRELGYLRTGQLVSVTRDDLVGQYVGHTAPKTKEVLQRAMGGVLLIDEAYYLYRPENERDYGQESIEILLQFMEAHREDLVVILAGYADRMDTFFRSNPGMASRIAHHIDFPDFTRGELLQIADLMLEREQYRLSPAAREAFAEYVGLRMNRPRFANARSIRNAIDRLRLRQARRLVAGGGLIVRSDLMEISAEDVRASRVLRDADRRLPEAESPAS